MGRAQRDERAAACTAKAAQAQTSAPAVDKHGKRTCTVRTLECRLVNKKTATVKLYTEVDIPAWQLFDTLADPSNLRQISEDIQETSSTLIEDNGGTRRWHVDCQARWRFWKLSGSCTTKMFLDTDRDQGLVKFTLREPGFLRTYEGCWTIQALTPAPAPAVAPAPFAALAPLLPQVSPALARSSSRSSSSSCGATGGWPLPSGPGPLSSLTFEVTLSPKISPPFPLNQMLKGQTKHQASSTIRKLVALLGVAPSGGGHSSRLSTASTSSDQDVGAASAQGSPRSGH